MGAELIEQIQRGTYYDDVLIKCTLPITTLKVKCFDFMRVEYRCSMQYHCGQTYYDSTMNNTILLGQSVINDSEKLGFPEISSYKNESFNNI